MCADAIGPVSNHLSRNRALVLDNAYRPINVVNWFKAVMMNELNKVSHKLTSSLS